MVENGLPVALIEGQLGLDMVDALIGSVVPHAARGHHDDGDEDVVIGGGGLHA
mgnify:CR=1 FL=1